MLKGKEKLLLLRVVFVSCLHFGGFELLGCLQTCEQI